MRQLSALYHASPYRLHPKPRAASISSVLLLYPVSAPCPRYLSSAFILGLILACVHIFQNIINRGIILAIKAACGGGVAAHTKHAIVTVRYISCYQLAVGLRYRRFSANKTSASSYRCLPVSGLNITSDRMPGTPSGTFICAIILFFKTLSLNIFTSTVHRPSSLSFTKSTTIKPSTNTSEKKRWHCRSRLMQLPIPQ
jgi:hypothetical protein